jgi:hypothetical protein
VHREQVRLDEVVIARLRAWMQNAVLRLQRQEGIQPILHRRPSLTFFCTSLVLPGMGRCEVTVRRSANRQN